MRYVKSIRRAVALRECPNASKRRSAGSRSCTRLVATGGDATRARLLAEQARDGFARLGPFKAASA
jgi:hypothetical protein